MSAPLERERLRRMRETWRRDAPSSFEVATAVGRVSARRRAGSNGGDVLATGARWGGLGAFLGLIAALALGAERPAAGGTPIQPEALALAEPALGQALPKPAREAKPPEAPAAKQSERRPPARTPRMASSAPASEAAIPAEPTAPASSAAGRWLAIGRGSDAGPIVVGLPKDQTTEPASEPARPH